MLEQGPCQIAFAFSNKDLAAHGGAARGDADCQVATAAAAYDTGRQPWECCWSWRQRRRASASLATPASSLYRRRPDNITGTTRGVSPCSSGWNFEESCVHAVWALAMLLKAPSCTAELPTVAGVVPTADAAGAEEASVAPVPGAGAGAAVSD